MASLTVITQEAEKLPHVAVIVALPTDLPVTRPVLLTVATAVLFDDQVTLPVAPDGSKAALNCTVLLTVISAVLLLNLIPVGSIGSPPLAGYAAIHASLTESETVDSLPKIFHANSGWSTNGFLFFCLDVSA